MRLKCLNSNKLQRITIKNYLIDWDKPSVSKPQTTVKNFLYDYWKNCIVLEECRIPGSLLRLDFLNINKKIIIEVSPKNVHDQFNLFFHKTRIGYLNSLKRDFKKIEWAEAAGYTLLEIYEEDIKKNLNYEWFVQKFAVYL